MFLVTAFFSSILHNSFTQLLKNSCLKHSGFGGALVHLCQNLLNSLMNFIQVGLNRIHKRYIQGRLSDVPFSLPLQLLLFLFSVMVNDLVSTWPNRAKYVDDLTIVEVIPRISPSYLNCIVGDTQCFSHRNNIPLNPAKCKAMTIDLPCAHLIIFEC